jgi:hypothetical protein
MHHTITNINVISRTSDGFVGELDDCALVWAFWSAFDGRLLQ